MAKLTDKPPRDYEVGYARPPKGSQFQPGESGNLKGRPKGQPSASEIFMREAARHVRVQVGDKVETISKLEAAIRKLFQMAIAGDVRAMGMVMGANARLGIANDTGQVEAGEEAFASSVPDEDALRRMLSRFDHLKPL